MADVAARREARRKRILENSQNRLQLISGNNDAECLRESPVTVTSPIPIITEYEIPTASVTSTNDKLACDNGVIYQAPSEPGSSIFPSSNSFPEFLTTAHVDAVNDLSSLLPQPSQNSASQGPTLTIWEKIVAYKYDIVLLSILVQLLYSFGVPIFGDHYIFLPLMVYTTTRLSWLPSESNSSLTNILLLLNGMDSAKIKKIMFFIKVFGAFSQDVFVFIFATVCCQASFTLLSAALDT